MAEAWPGSLPPIPQLPVMIGFEDGVLRSQNDIGPAQTRRVTTAMPEPLRFRMVLTYTQLTAFKTFWDTIQGRALPFTHYWPLTKTSLDMRFTALPAFHAHGADIWEVELEAEVLPVAS